MIWRILFNWIMLVVALVQLEGWLFGIRNTSITFCGEELDNLGKTDKVELCT